MKKKTRKSQPARQIVCERCRYRMEEPNESERVRILGALFVAGATPEAADKALLDYATTLGAHRCDEMLAEREAARLRTLLDRLQGWRETARKAFDGLATKGAANLREQMHQLSWSHDTFLATAKGWVAEWAIDALNGSLPDQQITFTPARIYSVAMDETLRGARLRVNRSTSPTQNLIAEATLAAWADLEETLRHMGYSPEAKEVF